MACGSDLQLNQFSLRFESLSGIGDILVAGLGGWFLSGDLYKDITSFMSSASCEEQAMYLSKALMDLLNSSSNGEFYDSSVTDVINKFTGGLDAKTVLDNASSLIG